MANDLKHNKISFVHFPDSFSLVLIATYGRPCFMARLGKSVSDFVTFLLAETNQQQSRFSPLNSRGLNEACITNSNLILCYLSDTASEDARQWDAPYSRQQALLFPYFGLTSLFFKLTEKSGKFAER
jgi:hypothetical protein